MALVLTVGWGGARVSNRYSGLTRPDHENVELLCANQAKLIAPWVTQQRQGNRTKRLAREIRCKHTGVNTWAHIRTVQMFSSLWGLEQGQAGTYWITEQTVLLWITTKIRIFLFLNPLSVVFLITTDSQNHIYIYVWSLLTVAIMKMHLFFFWILFSLAIATSPGKKPRRVFLSLVWQNPSLYFKSHKAQKPRAATSPSSLVAVLLLSQF